MMRYCIIRFYHVAHAGEDVAILNADELDIISHSAEQTMRLGSRLGALLQAGDVVCLSGDMGAGKTVFTAGIGQGWGARNPITSPTYNLIHQHERARDDLKLYHLDCYRLRDANDAETIGLDDILEGAGVIVFEWPERIADALPKSRLWVELRVTDLTRRNLIFSGQGARYKDLVVALREKAYGV